jgi:TonB family protein
LPAISQNSQPDEAAKKKIYRAGADGIGTPVCIRCAHPGYSKKARADKLQGSVELEAIISLEGKVTKVTLVRGIGEGLDEKAIEAVKLWKFKPAVDRAGNPVDVFVPIEVTFRLRD